MAGLLRHPSLFLQCNSFQYVVPPSLWYNGFRATILLTWKLGVPKVHVPKRDPDAGSLNFHDLDLQVTNITFTTFSPLEVSC